MLAIQYVHTRCMVKTEEELLQNVKKHGIEVHGYTEQTWNEENAKNADHFRKLIKTT